MLDEQFFSDSTFGEYVNNNFVSVYALRGEPIYDELKKAYNTSATPTVVIAEAGAAEIDRIVGYGPPPEGLLTKVTNAANRIDTFEALIKEHEENPDDPETTFKLAYKYERNFGEDDIAQRLYREIIDRSDEAKSIMVPYSTPDDMISIQEWSLFRLGFKTFNAIYYEALVKDFPDTRFSNIAYRFLAPRKVRAESSREVVSFFEKIVEKYPDDVYLLNCYVRYCINAQTNIDRGIEIAELIQTLISDREPSFNPTQFYAELLMMKGDSTKAKQVYGNRFFEREVDDATRLMVSYSMFWERQNANLESARRILNRSFAMEPENYVLRGTAALGYMRLNREEDALRVYGQEHIADENIDKSILYNYASFWADMGINLESAFEAIMRYKELNNGRGGHSTLAKIYIEMDNIDEALKEYGSEYIKEHTTNPSELTSYAMFWAEKEKNLESALEAVKKSMELEPKMDIFNYDTLSLVYWKMKKYKEAIEAEEKALELSPGNKSYLKRIEDIKKDMKKKS